MTGQATRFPSLWVLIGIATVAPVAMNVYLPSLPNMAEAFDSSASAVQLSVSVFVAALAVFQLIVGPLSDKYGRRPIVVWGMAIYTLGSFLCLAATTIEYLILARILQALGCCTGLSLGRAIIRDVYDREQSASMIGYVTMGMTLGPLAGPMLGGILQEYIGWIGSFYVMAALGAVVLLSVVFCLPETNRHRHKSEGFKGAITGYGEVMRTPLFWAYASSAMLVSAVYFTFLGAFPYVGASYYDLSPFALGYYLVFIAAGYIFGNGITGKVAARIGVIRMIVAGSLMNSLSVVIAALMIWLPGHHAFDLFLPMFVLGVGSGVCLPSALSGAVSAAPERIGAASGLTSMMQFGAGAGFNAIAAWLVSKEMWAGSPWPLIIQMLILSSLVWIAVSRIQSMEAKAERNAA